MGAVVLLSKSDPAYPFFDQPRILSRAEVIHSVNAAREGVAVNRATATFQPCQQAGTSWFEQFELHRPLRLLLDDHRPVSNTTTRHEVANTNLHQITAAEFAVDRKIEERSISQSMLPIEH